MEDVEKRVIGKVMRRLVPFLILCYFVPISTASMSASPSCT